MGLKDAAKVLMEKAGVPVVPGYHGEGQGQELLAAKAREIGYPVLIKARAGGGGKGMRRVDHPDEFADALAGARREAKSAFGDDHVLIEKYVEKPRHIEVQVFGDNFGNAVHLFERDCSAQRRHQKVIEEAPAPGMTGEMRSAMTGAAVTAARAIGYSGAGTIEFIVDASAGLSPDRFWFMEMNTRLQVEHPVTEMISGVDLVEWQLRVAAGEPLPKTQEEIRRDGHAFEARLYAEDATKGFLPATGTLHHLTFPETALPGTQLRVETGVRAGDSISPYYDPMIAKLVSHGPDRASALAALVMALESTEVAGSVTNLAFLAALARDPDFASGDVDTGLIDRKQAALTPIPAASEQVVAEAVLAASGIDGAASSADPWDSLAGYAHFHPVARLIRLRHGQEEIAARAAIGAGGTVGVTFEGAAPFHKSEGKATARRGKPHEPGDAMNKSGTSADASSSRLAGPSTGLTRAVRWPGHVTVFRGAVGYDFAVADPLDSADESQAAGSMRAPMPGLVKVVRAAVGDAVKKGQPLLILEAMKMEHTIAAAHDGEIAEIAAEGAQVSEGAVLVRFVETA